MPLDPQLAFILKAIERAGQPEYPDIGAQAARALHEKGAPALDLKPMPVFHTDEVQIPVGAHSIPARLYHPRETHWAAPQPLLIWYHGGGFTVGSVASYDPVCRMLANAADCLVLSVDYRLAPEYKFPTAVDDAFAALTWAREHAHRYGIDDQRIAVGGDSAGGTLSAVVALMARDAGIPLALQLLIYPGTDAYQDTPSHHNYAHGYLLERPTILWFFEQYLRSPADNLDWRFAPLLANSHAELPPAWIAVAEYDPLIDEGIAYAHKLEHAGVLVALKNYRGMVHAFFSMGGALETARQAHADAAQALRQAFEKKSGKQ
ncbi:MAG: alpha/beta hydrolase [Burkholderiaceae bacterium]|nr:MAG: alpha/beta hydrolase [Burkholderiaceae bacterium]